MSTVIQSPKLLKSSEVVGFSSPPIVAGLVIYSAKNLRQKRGFVDQLIGILDQLTLHRLSVVLVGKKRSRYVLWTTHSRNDLLNQLREGVVDAVLADTGAGGSVEISAEFGRVANPSIRGELNFISIKQRGF